jgi:ubiquinone/menaquinone biosynthesis C-methylase UbiE
MLGMPAAWSRVARDYHDKIAPDFVPAARRLCEQLKDGPADRVLDVACGPGTAAEAARELGAREVVGVDYARAMLFVARDDGPPGAAHYVAANAMALPFAPESFDVVVSSFGIIFAPDPGAAVRECARVLAPEGRIGLLVWPPDGSIGEYQRIAFQHLDIPPSAHDPFEWGVPERAQRWLAPLFDRIRTVPLTVPFAAQSPEAAWQTLSTATGRVAAAYAELGPEGRERLDADMAEFFRRFENAGGGVAWERQAMMLLARRA